MSGTRPAAILTVSSANLLRSSNIRWGNSPVLPSTEIPSTPAATKRSTTASVARKSISPRSSKGVTIAGIDPVNIRLVSPVSSKARLLRASRLIYLHPTPSPDGRQNDKGKSTTPLRAEVASRGRQRLLLSGVALGSRRRGAVWFPFDPLDEPADIGVGFQGLERVVLSLELLVVEDDVHVPMAGGAQT